MDNYLRKTASCILLLFWVPQPTAPILAFGLPTLPSSSNQTYTFNFTDALYLMYQNTKEQQLLVTKVEKLWEIALERFLPSNVKVALVASGPVEYLNVANQTLATFTISGTSVIPVDEKKAKTKFHQKIVDGRLKEIENVNHQDGSTGGSKSNHKTAENLKTRLGDIRDRSTVTPFMNVSQKLTFFRMESVSWDDCLDLDTQNCILFTNSEFCSSKYFYVDCTENATDHEVTSSMASIAELNRDRPIQIKIQGPLNSTKGMFASVRNNVISLTFTYPQNLSIPSLRFIDLPNLIELNIENQTNLELHEGDLNVFPKLRILKFYECSFTSIEKGSFDHFYGLKLLSLEWKTTRTFTSQGDSDLLQLHCGCHYKWLRDFFQARKYLLKSRDPLEIYDFGGWGSDAVDQTDTFVTVNCATREIVGSFLKAGWSVSDGCCSSGPSAGNNNHWPVNHSWAGQTATANDICLVSNASFADPDLDPEYYSEADILKASHVRLVLYPILLILCTVGNVMNLIVLLHEPAKNSTNAYLVTVAVADLFVMWLDLPIFWNHQLNQKSMDPAKSDFPVFAQAFWQYKGFNQWGRMTFILISDWTLLLFSLERLFAILMPLVFRGLQTAKRGWINCSILLVIAAIFTVCHAVTYYSYEYASIKNPKLKQPFWTQRWKKIQNGAEIIDLCINFLALIIINIIIIRLLHLYQKKFSDLQTNQERHDGHFSSTQILLMGSTVLFLITHFPYLVYAIIIIPNASDKYDTSGQRFATPLQQTVVDINYSANCYVYLLVSKRYRRDLLAILRNLCCRRFSGFFGKTAKLDYKSSITSMQSTKV